MNKFEEEIVRIKQERDARFAEINARIEELEVQNSNMNTLRQLNQEQIGIFRREKDLIGKEYRRKIAEVTIRKDDYYCENYSHEHYKRFAIFCDQNPDVLARWKEFRQQEEGGAL